MTRSSSPSSSSTSPRTDCAGWRPDVTALARELPARVVASCAPRHVIVVSERRGDLALRRRDSVPRCWHRTRTTSMRPSRAPTRALSGVSNACSSSTVICVTRGPRCLRSRSGCHDRDRPPRRGTNVLVAAHGTRLPFRLRPDLALLARADEARRLGIAVTSSPTALALRRRRTDGPDCREKALTGGALQWPSPRMLQLPDGALDDFLAAAFFAGRLARPSSRGLLARPSSQQDAS